MDKTYAVAIMTAYLQGVSDGTPKYGVLAITAERQLSEPDGWVFYWNTQKSVESGRSEDRLLGPGPTVVLADGRVFAGGSGDAMLGDQGIVDVLQRHGVNVDGVAWAGEMSILPRNS
jgi:Immunity protein 35